ncbi:hypothetical protein UY3_15782 [Chelonia mydas]|uniref:Uncharacterized protein n=1 Tax=Chelonia mydas TaxID=8469 RepID=M7B4W8_CHEMY|nr:hypothetical protein UY3_15782 [Chelonia mydas]
MRVSQKQLLEFGQRVPGVKAVVAEDHLFIDNVKLEPPGRIHLPIEEIQLLCLLGLARATGTDSPFLFVGSRPNQCAWLRSWRVVAVGWAPKPECSAEVRVAIPYHAILTSVLLLLPAAALPSDTLQTHSNSKAYVGYDGLGTEPKAFGSKNKSLYCLNEKTQSWQLNIRKTPKPLYGPATTEGNW